MNNAWRVTLVGDTGTIPVGSDGMDQSHHTAVSQCRRPCDLVKGLRADGHTRRSIKLPNGSVVPAGSRVSRIGGTRLGSHQDLMNALFTDAVPFTAGFTGLDGLPRT